MNEEQKDQLGEMISKLDTATGMLLMAAMKDPLVREAMELVTEVSFGLGVFVNESGESSGNESEVNPETEKRHAKEGETIVITKVLAPGGNGHFEVGDTLYALEVEANGDVLVFVEYYSHGKKSVYAVLEEYEVVIEE